MSIMRKLQRVPKNVCNKANLSFNSTFLLNFGILSYCSGDNDKKTGCSCSEKRWEDSRLTANEGSVCLAHTAQGPSDRIPHQHPHAMLTVIVCTDVCVFTWNVEWQIGERERQWCHPLVHPLMATTTRTEPGQSQALLPGFLSGWLSQADPVITSGRAISSSFSQEGSQPLV